MFLKSAKGSFLHMRNAKQCLAIALLLVALLSLFSSAFAQWWIQPEPALPPVDFEKIREEYGSDAAAFAKKIHLRFGQSLEQRELEGIAKFVKRFPEKNGKAVLDSMTDLRYSLWGESALSEIAALDEKKSLEKVFFRPSLLAKIGSKSVDAVASPDYRDFFIESVSLNQRLSGTKALYSKIVKESRRFREARAQDITVVIVLKKGTSLGKAEIEKTVQSAFENSANLEMQKISRIAVYNAGGKGKLITVYGKQDWIRGKMS